MDEVRLINATPLEKEMQEYALYIGRETTNECESTAECCADMVSEAPTIDPETLRPTWRDPEKNPPEVETEVLVLVDCGKGYCITRSIPTENVRCWMPKPKPPRKREPAKVNGGADR